MLTDGTGTTFGRTTAQRKGYSIDGNEDYGDKGDR